MKIAIVENEELQAQNLQEFLHKWLQEHNVLYEIVHFKSGEEIIASKIKNFDLVFMDILMDGIDGVTTAHKLRELGFNGQLVFLTSFAEYVFEGYNVHALNYLLKPVDYSKVAKCIEYVIKSLDVYILFSIKNGYRIPFSEIICFSSDNHYTRLSPLKVLIDRWNRYAKIYSYLPEQFLYCHRTAIINIEHVLMLNGREYYFQIKCQFQ